MDAGAGVVNGDSERLQQVVWNLLSNAIRFTPPGGRIQLRYARRGENVELLVRDSGQGLPRRPYRISSSAIGRVALASGARKGSASGLRSRTGSSSFTGVVSQPRADGEGHGASFTVTLPLHTADPEQIPATDDGTPNSDLEARALSNARMLDAATAELEAASSAALCTSFP